MSHNVDFGRRRFIGAALATSAIRELVVSRPGSAQSGSETPVTATNGTTGTSDALGTLRQVAAGVLNVGYADAGPANGPPVVLLHGWPYDIHSYGSEPALAVATDLDAKIQSLLETAAR